MKSTKVIKVVTDASVIRDGGKYKGRAGVLVLDDDNTIKHFESKHLGNVTSNEGEYLSLLEGVKYVTNTLKKDEVDLKNISLEMYTDSSLVYNQILGNFKTKKKCFVKMQNEIKSECKRFKGTKVIWHKRDMDLAMLADFGSKHPRRTKSIFSQFKGKEVAGAVEKAARFIIKDEDAAEREKARSK